MLFTYSSGNSLLNAIQQILNFRIYSPKNKQKSTLNNQKAEQQNLLRIYQKIFSTIDKEHFVKVLNGFFLIY